MLLNTGIYTQINGIHLSSHHIISWDYNSSNINIPFSSPLKHHLIILTTIVLYFIFLRVLFFLKFELIFFWVFMRNVNILKLMKMLSLFKFYYLFLFYSSIFISYFYIIHNHLKFSIKSLKNYIFQCVKKFMKDVIIIYLYVHFFTHAITYWHLSDFTFKEWIIYLNEGTKWRI